VSRGTLVDCVIPEEEPLLGKHELHHCPGQADVTTSTSYVYNEKCVRLEALVGINGDMWNIAPTNLTNLIIGAVLGGIFGSFVLLFTTIKLREVVKSIKETVKANAVAAQRTSPATAITYAEAQSSVVPPGPVGLTFAGNKAPCVVTISEASPLKTVMLPQALMLKVDEADVTTLSSTALGNLLKSKAGQNRTLTFRNPTSSNGTAIDTAAA